MITVDDIKFELNNNELEDIRIARQIERSQKFLRSYTNNPDLFLLDDEELDEALLYVVCSRFNEDVKGRQGLSSEGLSGVSFSFQDDLPTFIKNTLSKHRRIGTK